VGTPGRLSLGRDRCVARLANAEDSNEDRGHLFVLDLDCVRHSGYVRGPAAGASGRQAGREEMHAPILTPHTRCYTFLQMVVCSRFTVGRNWYGDLTHLIRLYE
jgi:hypothetical protein